MEKPEGGGLGRFLVTTLLVTLVLAMGSAVLYLLADINRRQYRVVESAGYLSIERGRHAPFGFEGFAPESEDLRKAYAPIPVPAGVSVGKLETVEDRSDLDRMLFDLLSAWARERLESDAKDTFELATLYLDRCDLLPGLSSEQEKALRTLRADLAYRNAQRILEAVIHNLQEAVDALRTSERLGTSRHTDAQQRIEQLERLIDTLRQSAQSPHAGSDAGAENAEAPGGVTSPPPPASSDGSATPKWRL